MFPAPIVLACHSALGSPLFSVPMAIYIVEHIRTLRCKVVLAIANIQIFEKYNWNERRFPFLSHLGILIF